MSQERLDPELKTLLEDFQARISAVRLEIPALESLSKLADAEGPASRTAPAPPEPEDDTARRIDELLAAAGAAPPAARSAVEPQAPPPGGPAKDRERMDAPIPHSPEAPVPMERAFPQAELQQRVEPGRAPTESGSGIPSPQGSVTLPAGTRVPQAEPQGRVESALPAGTRVPQAPAERRRRLLLALGGGLLAALAGAKGISDWQAHRLKQIHQVFPLPYTNTSALAEKAGLLYTLDPKRGLLFTFGTGDLKVRSVQKFSNPALSGLALGEDSVWSANAEAGEVYQHYLDPVFSVRNTFSNPESRPTAVHWDGRHLWTSDRRTETISQYSVDAVLTPVRQYTLAGIAPAGIHVSRGLLWIADTLSRKVYRYELGSLLSVRDTLDLGEWLSPNCRITGFAVGEPYLWLITENPAQLHRFRLEGLEASAQASPTHGTTPR